MDHQTLQRGVALLQCGREQGTATIVGPTIAVATRHSIIDHLENSAPIELRIPELPSPILASLHPVTLPVDEDIVLLRLATAVDASSVIQLSATHLPVGDEWQAFGFPSSRKAGAWIDGTVGVWLPQGAQPQDVELSVNNFLLLRSYRGYSGAPLWVAGMAVAFLQRQLNGGLAATSVLRLRRHLDAAGVGYRSANGGRSVPLALRAVVDEARNNTQTYWGLENALKSTTSGYTVLAGSPGSGKTIIAAAFTPTDPRTHVVGTYFAGGDGDPAGLPPELHRDPGAFASWLAQETALVTGEGSSSRSADSAQAHAASIERNLVALGRYFHRKNRLGVLIIDDFCGLIGGTVDGSLGRVLPKTPPTGLAIVLTSASEALVRTAAPHLTLGDVVPVTPLEQYDCERIVAAKIGNAVQSTDILRIASASDGNPLILSYLVREAQSALTAGQPLPPTDAAVPTAQAFYEQQWARLSGNDAGMWLVAFAARLRGRLPEVELSSLLPESAQLGLPTAWRTVGHLLRREADGVEVFHRSFREFVVTQTAVLDSAVHDRLADHCARESSPYAVANVVYHHLLGSPGKQQQAEGLFTQEWLDAVAARFSPSAYILADVEHLLRRALAAGSLDETIRLLLARSRLRFRYGAIFGKYAFELASVVSALRGARTALRLVVHDEQLRCAPHEAVALICRLILAEEYDAAVDVYGALRRVCFAQYQTGNVTWLSHHLESIGLLLREIGPKGMGEMRWLYRGLDRDLEGDGVDASQFKTRARALPAAAHLWRWGWFVHSIRYRASDPPRYCTELISIVEHTYEVARVHGAPNIKVEPPPPTEIFKIFTAQEAAAEIESSCRGSFLPEETARSAIVILMRHGRDPVVVSELAASLASTATIQLRQPNGVDADTLAVDALFRWSAIAEYVADPSLQERISTRTREPWEQRFLDAAAWLGATYGRLCRERRDSVDLTINVSAFLGMLTFTLADRSLWPESYALPEAVVPFLLTRLCEILGKFAPHLATTVSTWAVGCVDNQLGLYTEGCRAALWELAEGLSFCDIPSARAVWRAYFSHVRACTSNREERVSALLACAQGSADVADSELAEDALRHAIKASMGPSWYKEDQLTLLIDVLNAADSPALTESHWCEAVRLLEHASGDLTFQRFIRYQKEGLVLHLSTAGRLAEALALARNYIWPDEQTQLARIQSWKADKVSPIDGGRWGTSEIDPQAAALALLEGMVDAPTRYRWAIIELFLPGDDRHLSSFAELMPALFESEQGEDIRARLLRLLVADFVPDQRASFVRELRELQNGAIDAWLDEVQEEYEWARPAVKGADIPTAPVAESNNDGSSPPPDLYAPGMFGHREGIQALDEAVAAATAQRAMGDEPGARERFVEGLAAMQSAGRGIWHPNSGCSDALRGLFNEPGNPGAALRALSNIILGEEHVLDWQIAAALIAAALPGRDEPLVLRVVDEVFAHTRAMLAPELADDVEYELRSLTAVSPSTSAAQATVELLLTALDDACGHFRDRAASVLRWLLISESGFDLEPIIERACLAVGRHSRELCLGIIHSWFVATPEIAKAALTARPAFAALRTDPSFAARYVVSQIDGTMGVIAEPEQGSVLTATQMHPSSDSRNWQLDCEKILEIADGETAHTNAVQQLSRLCGQIDPWTMVGLWRLRRGAVASKDFWSSAYEREAVWRSVTDVDAEQTIALADQLMWNPQWPDATLSPPRSGVCELIFERVREQQLDDCFIIDGQLVLHCREETFDERDQEASRFEIVALLVPSAYFNGYFNREQLYERRSTHGPLLSRSSILASAVEPAVVKFTDRRGCVGGSMTPARPSQKLLEASRALPSTFSRASWRDGREWEPVGVGRPLRDGSILTADPTISTNLAGFDLAWCLLQNGRLVALVDPARRRLFQGDAL